jgi:8-oxo-dGTP pyrophosphatase MutT (NUDIX family)
MVTDPITVASAPEAPIHRIAAAVLVRDGRVLLGHRHPLRKNYPDCWDIVGGHIEPGESPSDAVRRECLEELGIDIDDPQPIPMTVSDGYIEMHAFVVTRWSGHPENTAPDEHDELRWFEPNELGDLVLAHPSSLPDIVAATSRQLSHPDR